MKEYMMALDQGTTSSRCILFDKMGNIRAKAQKEFAQIYPQEGWVEHNPMEIWSSQLSVAVEAMGQIGAEADDIAAIGITNQRETTICFSKKTGKPVYPAIVWQCRRTADKIDALKKDGFDKVIRERTGLIPDAYFSGSKLSWLLDRLGLHERAERGEILDRIGRAERQHQRARAERVAHIGAERLELGGKRHDPMERQADPNHHSDPSFVPGACKLLQSSAHGSS